MRAEVCNRLGLEPRAVRGFKCGGADISRDRDTYALRDGDLLCAEIRRRPVALGDIDLDAYMRRRAELGGVPAPEGAPWTPAGQGSWTGGRYRL